ncbi:hypothetical protein [Chryseobacterium camelliae]|uniref:hypothetical protein n=1 Tax=Chryseobacterium camelliae TaxID=1265445 RepID=UPI0028589D41|nr:hypothetical protein [Chryseobacterium camelliae]MDR6516086.1 hypothetical protein [Chryseobacterium camelliae]
MKNTEYKDIFDFGAEALSMDHAFSTTQFPLLKNTFTIGEHIRGMNHVSPLATVKFFIFGQGKKVKIVVFSDKEIEGTRMLKIN